MYRATILAGQKLSNNQYIVRKEDFKDLIFFKFKELEVATNYFSDTNKLGRGGFGPVYKVRLYCNFIIT